jgi:hypothetical protein
MDELEDTEIGYFIKAMEQDRSITEPSAEDLLEEAQQMR